MNAQRLIAQVISQGGQIRVAGDKLKLSAPGPLPDDLMALIWAHKSEIMTALESPPVPAKKADAVAPRRQRQPAKTQPTLGQLLIVACRELDITPMEVYRELSDKDFGMACSGLMDLQDLRIFAHELIQRRDQEPAGESQGAQYDAAIVQLYDEETERLFNLFMDHLGGEGKATNCCNGPAGRYCEEGQRLKDAYYRKCN